MFYILTHTSGKWEQVEATLLQRARSWIQDLSVSAHLWWAQVSRNLLAWGAGVRGLFTHLADTVLLTPVVTKLYRSISTFRDAAIGPPSYHSHVQVQVWGPSVAQWAKALLSWCLGSSGFTPLWSRFGAGTGHGPYVWTFVSWVGGFLWVLRFPPPVKLTFHHHHRLVMTLVRR